MICSKIHESTVGFYFFFKIVRIVKCTETKSLLVYNSSLESFKVYCITILYKLQRVCLFIQHVDIIGLSGFL